MFPHNMAKNFRVIFNFFPILSEAMQYHMNMHAAGVEYIRNNRQRFIGPITEQLLVCCSNIHGVMHLL